MPTRLLANRAELDTYVDEVLAILPQKDTAHVLALSGELGAGKTTFVQTLARKLGVADHVTSPTFVIMNTYTINHNVYKRLVHIDAYRVEDISEIEVLHIPDYFSEAGTLVCIEWPERIASVIPKDAMSLQFTIGADESRIITYS